MADHTYLDGYECWVLIIFLLSIQIHIMIHNKIFSEQ